MTKAEFMLHHNQFTRGESITRLACRVQLLELQLQSLIGVYLPVTSMNNGTPAIGNFYSGGSISETRPIQVYVGANSTISLLLTQDGGGNLANCFANSTLHYWMVTMQYMT